MDAFSAFALAPLLPGKSLPPIVHAYVVDSWAVVGLSEQTPCAALRNWKSSEPLTPIQTRRNGNLSSLDASAGGGAVHFSSLQVPLLHSPSSTQSAPSPFKLSVPAPPFLQPGKLGGQSPESGH